MAKYSYEQKLKVALAVVRDGIPQNRAATLIGACKGDVQKWVKLYREHGDDGLRMKKHTYTGQFKVSVVEYMHAHHLSIRETAAKFGIPSHSTVGQWERIYYEKGGQALLDKTRVRKEMKGKLDKKVEEDLIAEVQRLRMEIEYLKKLNALVQARELREKKRK